jgi:hypothetical protein
MLSVDESIQKELEQVDQEIEATGEVTQYQDPRDIFNECVTYNEAEEEKLFMSTRTLKIYQLAD